MVRVFAESDRDGSAAARASAPHTMDDSPPARRSQPALSMLWKHGALIEQPKDSKDTAVESLKPRSFPAQLPQSCRNGEHHSCDSTSADYRCGPHAPPPRPRRSAGSAAAIAAGSGSDARFDCSRSPQRWSKLRFSYRIFLPNAEQISSTARSAVRFFSSITGFTSTTSKLSI